MVSGVVAVSDVTTAEQAIDTIIARVRAPHLTRESWAPTSPTTTGSPRSSRATS